MSEKITPATNETQKEKELSPSDIREKLKDPSFLPSIKEIAKAFDCKEHPLLLMFKDKVLPNLKRWMEANPGLCFPLSPGQWLDKIFENDYSDNLVWRAMDEFQNIPNPHDFFYFPSIDADDDNFENEEMKQFVDPNKDRRAWRNALKNSMCLSLKRTREPFTTPEQIEGFVLNNLEQQLQNMEWGSFCFNEKSPVYECWNKEHLEGLTNYLIQRVRELSPNNPNKPITILEVAAGNGRLSYFLQQMLEKKAPGQINIVATDSGDWKIEPLFPVQQMDYAEALEKIQPQIVITSWMPVGKDFTAAFRKTGSVKEYILIGETDQGCCGDQWLTWGFSEDQDKEKEISPYEADGFEKTELNELPLQICRTDNNFGCFFHSHTVSFQKK
jgi:hypothetical protein